MTHIQILKLKWLFEIIILYNYNNDFLCQYNKKKYKKKKKKKK